MVVPIERSQIPHNYHLWRQVQHHSPTNNCFCGRYAFYYECGHTIGSAILFRCQNSGDFQTGHIILCYHPARFIQVYDVNIRGRCNHCA
jgi:hypothetical protein